MEHIEIQQIEKFIISREDFTPGELDNITAHLAQCTYCKDHAEKLTAFYDGVSKELHNEPTERDKVFSEKILTRRKQVIPFRKPELAQHSQDALDTYFEIIEPYHRPLMQRFARYIQIHPVRFASATSLAGFMLVASFLLIKPAFEDKNPAFAKIKDYVLTVYNKEAEVIWTKSVVGIPDASTVESSQYRNFNANPRRLLLADIDDDNKNELLLTGSDIGKEFTEDTLYCFNSDGNIKWKHGVGPAIAFGKLDFTAYSTWLIVNIFVVNNNKSGKSKLFALALQRMYSPSKLFEINPTDGTELQSYWHRGVLYSMITMDLDNDGREEIILGGVNNNFDRACIAVLEPENINGYTSPLTENIPHGISRATEKYYLLLPFTNLGQLLSVTTYNCISVIEIVGNNLFRAYTEEIYGREEYDGKGIIYTFGEGMKVKTLLGDASFQKLHKQYEKEGNLSQKYGPEYLQSLKDSIKYWDGEKFVNTPTINKFYQKAHNYP
ncbi:MAG: hypothetical protein Q8K98_03215 [Bacteroidota bacterium]|nr:hypothetical protein [Bacteroidota bacterium]